MLIARPGKPEGRGRRLVPALRRRLVHHRNPAPGGRRLARALTSSVINTTGEGLSSSP